MYFMMSKRSSSCQKHIISKNTSKARHMTSKKLVMTSKIHSHDAKKFVVMSKTLHDVKNFVMKSITCYGDKKIVKNTSWLQYVHDIKNMSWRQNVRQDVRQYVMTLISLSWRQKHVMTSKTSSWHQKPVITSPPPLLIISRKLNFIVILCFWLRRRRLRLRRTPMLVQAITLSQIHLSNSYST